MKARVLITALSLFGSVLIGCGHIGGLQTTGSSLPASGLQDLHTISDLQTRFQQNIGKPRLILLVSPT